MIGTLDRRRQLWALLLLELRTSTRRHKLAAKSRLHPVTLNLLVHFFIGIPAALLVLTGSLDGHQPTSVLSHGESKLVLWAMAFGVITALGEMEQLWLARTQHELLGALPLSRSQVLFAKAVMLLLLAAAYALVFALPSLLMAPWVLQSGLTALWLLPCQIVLGATSAAGLALLVCLGMMALIPTRFARGAFSMVRLFAGLVAFVLPYGLMMQDGLRVLHPPAWLHYLPPIWLLAPFEILQRGWVGPATWQLPAGLGYAVVMVLGLWPMLRAAESRIVESTRSGQRRRRNSTQTTAQLATQRVSWLAPRAPLRRAAYCIAPRLIWRDTRLRSALIGQLMFPLVYLVLLLVGPFHRLTMVLVFAPTFLSFSMSMLQVCSFSEHPDAAWVLSVMPIDDARPLWEGVQRYLLLHVLTPSVLIGSLIAAIASGEPLAFVAALPLLLSFACAGLELGHFLVNQAPFTRPLQMGAAQSRLVTSLAVLALLVVLAASLIAAYVLTRDLNAVLALAVGLGLVVWAVARWARRSWAPIIAPPVESASGSSTSTS